MKYLLTILTLFIANTICTGTEYVNKDLGFALTIPKGAKAVEGNPIKPLTETEEEAFNTVFGVNPEEIKKWQNNIVFSIGYYSGAIENGSDASLSASTYKVESSKKDQVEEFTKKLIESEENENQYMSFKFNQKAKIISISNKLFFVSKGVLKIKEGDKVTFSMPIYYYITKFKSFIVMFTLSGDEKLVKTLEISLLSIKTIG